MLLEKYLEKAVRAYNWSSQFPERAGKYFLYCP